MPESTYSAVFPADPGSVLRAVAEQPTRIPEWWHTIVSVDAQAPLTSPGVRCTVALDLRGTQVKGEWEVASYQPGAYLALRAISGIEGVYEFLVEPHRDGSKVTVRAAYTLPAALKNSVVSRLSMEAQLQDDLADALVRLIGIVAA